MIIKIMIIRKRQNMSKNNDNKKEHKNMSKNNDDNDIAKNNHTHNTIGNYCSK